jgi:hypothetical protein
MEGRMRRAAGPASGLFATSSRQSAAWSWGLTIAAIVWEVFGKKWQARCWERLWKLLARLRPAEEEAPVATEETSS